METDKKNTENKTGEGQAKNSNPLDGFDFSKLLQNEGVMELLKHLLSGGGAMAANYFLWIKPLQEKHEAMNTKITLQEKRIEELEVEQDKLIEQLNQKKMRDANMNAKGDDFFTTKRDKPHSGNNGYKSMRL